MDEHEVSICNHKYVHIETVTNQIHSGNTVTWSKTDRFFCESCLDIKDINRIEEIEVYKGKPAWY